MGIAITSRMNARAYRRSRTHAHASRMIAFILGVVFMVIFVAPAFAATGVPKILNYQGRLMDESGTLLGGAGTDYCFTFSLYDDAVVGGGDVKLWPSSGPSTSTVSVINGVFTVGIGDTSVGGDTLDYNFQDSDEVYLNVQVADKVGATCATGDGVETYETLSPRQRILSSAYAINAGTVGGFTPSQTPTGNNIPVLSGGSMALTGAVSASGASFSTSTITNATSTTLAVTGNASTSNLVVSNGFTFGTAGGILKAVAGVVTATLVDLANDVAGILGVSNGGTGWASVVAGTILYGNGTSALATTTAGTAGQVLALLNGIPTWTATTTFSGGLTYADGAVTNSGVTSITGTTNQISASGATGAVTLSLPALLAITNASSTAISGLDYITVGRTATTTIQGGTTGTSTLQGFLNVVGTNSTSTFSGGIAANRMQLTGLTNCTKALETDANGTVVCGSDTGVDAVTVEVFTLNDTWTKADYPGLSFTQIIVTAGGGAGGAADCSDTTTCEDAAGGGGSGGTSISILPAESMGSTETVTVGNGGATTSVAGTGAAGNNSSFGSLVVALAGQGGLGDSSVDTNATEGLAGGSGGATSTAVGQLRLAGGNGGAANALSGGEGTGGNGGASYWGGGGAGGHVTAALQSVQGEAGLAYGSGGGGGIVEESTTAAQGGKGGQGVVVTMNYTSSGADLAEWYETKDDVEHGDVVAISTASYEYDSKLGLQKSSVLEKATQGSSAVGVVSSVPYETMGYDIFSKAKHPRAIALAGRVPVKANKENGEIKAGDLLTVSSEPGVAMRATKAGVTVGHALEDAICDDSGKCSVLVMVNTSYSTGALLKVALRDSGINMDVITSDLDYGRIILAGMLQEKKEITVATTLSEVFTDRLAAGLEIISPRVIADTLVVNAIEPVEKDIRMRIVEGGRLLIERVNENDLTLTFENASSSDAALLVSVDALGNALFAGALTANGLEVGSPEKPTGITMYDDMNGDPYCAKVVSGILQTFAGKCGAEDLTATIDSSAPKTSIEVPVITLNGNNPAQIGIGDTYIDLGATVTDDKDQNLGIYTFVDSEEVDHVMLDTSSSTEYLIMYRAVDSDGHVAEVTRVVVVGDGLPDMPPADESMMSVTAVDAEGESSSEPAAPQESPAGETTANPEPASEDSVVESTPAAETPSEQPASETAVETGDAAAISSAEL